MNISVEYVYVNRISCGGYDDGDIYFKNEDGSFDLREIDVDCDWFYYGFFEIESYILLGSVGYVFNNGIEVYLMVIF